MRSQISPESKITFALHALLPRRAGAEELHTVCGSVPDAHREACLRMLTFRGSFSMSRFPQTFFPAFGAAILKEAKVEYAKLQ
jgi:hypothetical protein